MDQKSSEARNICFCLTQNSTKYMLEISLKHMFRQTYVSGLTRPLGSVLTDVILTDGRLFDAFGTVNERRKSVQKAKASSVLVDLREHSPSTLSVDAFSTLSLGPFFRPFQAFGLATLSPRRFVMDHSGRALRCQS